MKAILYVGGALMVAASIYGFVDFKKSSQSKNFRDLYEDKKEITIPKERQELNVTKEEPVKITDVKKQTETTVKNEEVKNKELKASSTTDKKPVIKKKRKIGVENFSRAPLDEKYLKEKIITEPKKKEVKIKEL